jgi:uncharacterized protein (TIGR02596 family)
LVELLVVVAVITVVASFAIPATNTILWGSQLTQGAQMLSDQLELARQTALSTDRTIQVRFYQYGDPQIPGQQASQPSSGHYCALQIFQVLDSGSFVAIGKLQRLPQSVIIDSGATLSSIIGLAQQVSQSSPSAAIPASDSGSDLKTSIPVIGLSYNCVYFNFLPDGSTNFSSFTTPWFLTVHKLQDGDPCTSPPANFSTLQIDATNGHIRTFRP